MTVAVVTVGNGAVDEKGHVLLDIEGGNREGLFRLERGQSFAVVRVNRTVKLKCGTRHELILKARNPQHNGTQQPLEIFVRCPSDKGSIPSSRTNYTFRVREDTAIGSRIGRIQDDGKQELRYKLLASNVPFSIDNATGVITLTYALDFNVSDQYDLEISITDSPWSVSGSSSFVRIEVQDVNNHAPIFDKQLYTVEVTEELTGEEPLITVHARDDDAGENQRISYFIVDHSARPLFRITASGRVYARIPWQSLAKQRAYFFRIGARDHGIPSLEGFTNVQLFLKTRTYEPPYFEDAVKYATIRATDQPGKQLVKVQAVDRSGLGGYNLTYILYEASSDTISLGHEDGWLHLKRSQPDVPQPRILTAKIGAVDGRGNPTINNVTVHITCLPNQAETLNCSLRNLKRHVRENMPLGYTLGRVQCHLLNASMTVKYAIDGVASKFLSINPADGEVRTIQMLDRETLSVIPFMVRVDLNRTVAARSCKILLDDVNDNIPSFTKSNPTELRVGKEVPLGGIIGQLQATDRDAGDNSKLLFLADNNYVVVNASSGAVSLRNVPDDVDHIQTTVIVKDMGEPQLSAQSRLRVSLPQRPPVYSFANEYRFLLPTNTSPGSLIANLAPVNASVGRYIFSALSSLGPVALSADGSLYLRSLPSDSSTLASNVRADDRLLNGTYSFRLRISFIAESNMRAPTCESLNYTIREDSPIGTIVGYARGKDPDDGLNGLLTYELLAHTDKFVLDAFSGKLTTKVAFDAEATEEVTIQYRISDHGIVSRWTDCSSVLTIDDVNDNGPVFTKPYYYFEVAYGMQPDFITVNASDKDSGRNGLVKYALSDPLDTFRINATTGEIVLLKEPRPDRLYNLSISACDDGSHRRCDETIVLIHVADLRDFPPTFTSGSHDVVLSRRAPLGTILTQLSAKHAKHPVTYRLLEHSEHFLLDRFTGELILVKSLRDAKATSFVLVAETPSGNATTTIDLELKDDDDNVEAATDEQNREAYFFVWEDAVVGQFVGQLPTGVQSAQQEVRYQLLSVDVPFAIDYGTGIILTTQALDHEQCAFYKLPIRVTREGVESVLNGYVFVEDRNDNAPKFLEEESSVTVDESIPVGTEIYRLRYSDEDTVNEFRFSINVSSDPLQQFSVDDNGVVSLAGPLSFGRIPSYQLRITLHDAAPTSHGHTVSTTLRVEVNQSNRHTSSALATQHLFVSEKALVGTNIGQVTLSRDRMPDMISHYIIPSSNVRGMFAVDPVFGYVYVNKPIDREKAAVHTFTVGISDMEGFDVASQNLTIHVLDEDDNPPIIYSRHADPIVIPENSPVGTFITRIEYTDADEGQNSVAAFDITSGNEAHHFRVGVTSGCIYVSDELDVESATSYVLNVSVRALSGMHPQQHETVKIRVTDVNDEAPRFLDGEVLHLHVSENAGTSTPFLLKTITTVDSEQSINGFVTYSLHDDSGLFTLDATTGSLTLVGALDYETTVFHELVVTAFDSGHPRLWSSIKVIVVVHDENDNPPQFTSPYYRVAIPEDQAVYAKEMIQVYAKDADSGGGGELHYSLVDADTEPFEIDPLSGVIRLLAPLDFERKSRYELKVRAEDHGEIVRLSATINVTVEVVDVNDNAPLIMNTQFDAYIPSASSGEHVVYVVDATDADLRSSLKYTLSGSDRSSFSIDAHGAVRRSPEFVAKIDYSLTVTVSDEDDQSATVSLRLYLLKDHTFPKFEASPTSLAVYENVSDFSIEKFTAKSPSGSVRYYLASGNPFGEFEIDSFSGQLTCLHADRERRNEYLIQIAASTATTPSLTTYHSLRLAILDINDEEPVFDEPFWKVDLTENQPPQKDFVSVHATDRDDGPCGQVEYSIVDGDVNGSFIINPATGSLSTTASLDRENVPLYRLTVAAQDKCSPLRSSMSIVEVTVKDLNDNAPKFTRLLRASVPEDALVGTVVTKVSCEDPDEPGSQALRYSMEGQGSENFAIDAASGDVTLLAHLDRDLTSQYNLRVNAFDGVWHVSTKLTIAVDDANDNASVFALDRYDISVPAGTQFGDVLGRVTAHDADLNQNSEVRYSLAEDSRYVRIDPVSGHLTSLANFMSDAPDVIWFEVLARDRGLPPQSTVVNCTLYVVSSDNRPPMWTTNRRKYTIPLGVTSFVVADLKAADEDHGRNGETTYRIEPAVNGFWIHSSNGTLYANLTAPAEFGRAFYLTIVASDKGAPPMETSLHVSVHPTELNEHSPVFALNSYTFTITEDACVGTVVGAVHATDSDTGMNGYFEYHLDSSVKHPFFINATTGDIMLNGVLDHETADDWRIAVIATDYGYPSRSALTSVLINVADVNDNPPQFVPPTASTDIPEDTSISAVVYVPTVVDRDSELYAESDFSLHGSSPFAANPQTGEVFLTAPLESHDPDHYSLELWSRNRHPPYHNGTLHLDIRIRRRRRLMPVFGKHRETYYISSAATTGTIVGHLPLIRADSTLPRSAAFYIERNDMFDVDRRTGELFMKSDARSDTKKATVEVIAENDGHLSRLPPDRCIVEVVFQDDIPPSPVFDKPLYNVSLRANAQIPATVHEFEFGSASPGKLHLENGNADDLFCIRHPATLVICRQPPKPGLRVLTLSVASKGHVRSRCSVNVNISGDSVVAHTHESYVVRVAENVPYKLSLLMLPSTFNGASRIHVHLNQELDQIFDVKNQSELTIKRPLDREHQDLYVVPFTSGGKPPVRHGTIRIHVTDEDDNPSSFELMTVYLCSECMANSKVPLHPPDADIVFAQHECKAQASAGVQINEHCDLTVHNGTVSLHDLNVTYLSGNVAQFPVKLIVNDVKTSSVVSSLVSLQSRSSVRAMSNFLRSMMIAFPDLKLEIRSADIEPPDFVKICVLLDDARGTYVPASEIVRVVEAFYKKYSASTSLDNFAVKPDASCVLDATRTSPQSGCTVIRSFDAVWIVPTLNHTPHDHDDNKGPDSAVAQERVYSMGIGSAIIVKNAKVQTELQLQFATKDANGLLLFSFPEYNFAEHFIVDVFNGKIRLSGYVAGSHMNSTVIPASVNDGSWHRLVIYRQSTTVTVSVDACKPAGSCEACRASSCKTSFFLDTAQFPIFDHALIGGTTESDEVLCRLHMLTVADFRGCLRGISTDKRPAASDVVQEHDLLPHCPLMEAIDYCQRYSTATACGSGTCVNDWGSYKCICEDGYEATTCDNDADAVRLAGTGIFYSLTSLTRRFLRLKDHGATFAELTNANASGNSFEPHYEQWMDLDFRTKDADATLFTLSYGGRKSVVRIENGTVSYGVVSSKIGNLVKLALDAEVNDGRWHRLSIDVDKTGTKIRLQVDGQGKEIATVITFPKFVFEDVQQFVLGKPHATGDKLGVHGCIRRFVLNNQLQPLRASTPLPNQFLLLDTDKSVATSGCEVRCAGVLDVGCIYASFTWNESPILVLLLLLAICSFVGVLCGVLFHRRRRTVSRLRNAQRVSNMQLVSTCESTYRQYCAPDPQSSSGSLYEQCHINEAYSRNPSGSSTMTRPSSRDTTDIAAVSHSDSQERTGRRRSHEVSQRAPTAPDVETGTSSSCSSSHKESRRYRKRSRRKPKLASSASASTDDSGTLRQQPVNHWTSAPTLPVAKLPFEHDAMRRMRPLLPHVQQISEQKYV